ncbi:MAG: polysaccharide export protein [Cyanothece sp. SIO2G6]|nr:polysaccharide export protein [Cyanothece sp. SIO2G6]
MVPDSAFSFGLGLLIILGGIGTPIQVSRAHSPETRTIQGKATAQELLEEAREQLVNSSQSDQPTSAPATTVSPTDGSTLDAPMLDAPMLDAPMLDAPMLDTPTQPLFLPFPELSSPDRPPVIDFDAYRLGPGDSFFVSVEGFPEANFQATLDLEGNVLVPIVGIRAFQGLTLNEAKAFLQEQMNRFFVDPVVDLTLVVRRPVSVTMLGEVVRPGFYPLADPQLATALLSSGGVTRLANLATVQIRRTVRDRTGQVIQVLEQNIDLFHALAQGQNIPNVRLEDGDVIIVPTLTAAEAAEYDRALIAQSNLAQPLITVRVLSYPTRIGNLSLPNGSTFVDAVTAISPLQSEANIRKIGLIRFDPISEQVTTTELDAKSALLGDMSQNVVLENNDVLVINRSFLNRISFYLNTFTQPFRDILGFLLFFDTLSESADELFAPSGSSD